MTNSTYPKSKSSIVPVPLLIVFRSFSPTSTLAPHTFSWSSFEGVSKYILKLQGSAGIIWVKEVSAEFERAGEKETVTYDGATMLQPEADYLFTVEIDPEENYPNYPSIDNISEYVKKATDKIEQTDLPRQFKANILARIDGLLIARKEILNIVQGVTEQGSRSEVMSFLDSCLNQASAFKLLANALDCDDMLEAICEIACQLAAANITLGQCLQLSGVQTLLAENLVSRGAELALFAQDSQGAFQLGQAASVRASRRCISLCDILKRRGVDICDYPRICGGCEECR